MGRNAALPETLTANGVARRLGIRIESVYRLLYVGLLAGKRQDGKWAVSAQSVEEYARNHSRKAAREVAAV